VRPFARTRTTAGVVIDNCPIREHAGDGHYVGRCDFATHDGVCPRHGPVADYPSLDDRDVAVPNRRWSA
jgi:hypothetical protein